VVRLAVRNVAIERGDRLVLDGVSFEVGAGEAVVLRGPNGTGKTTLIRAIAGLLPCAAGEIRFEGAGLEDETRPGPQCHYISHRNALKADLTVRQNLFFWSDYSGRAALEFDAVAEQVDLVELADIPVRYLSAGQQRRAALARLIASSRPLWLLDEPTVSLDEAHTALFAEIVNRHLAEGGLIVAATHTPLGFSRERVLRLGELDRATAVAGEAAP